MRLKGGKARVLCIRALLFPKSLHTPLDYSFKIDQTGKKEKNNNALYDYARLKIKLAGDPSVLATKCSKNILERMVPDVERAESGYANQKTGRYFGQRRKENEIIG